MTLQKFPELCAFFTGVLFDQSPDSDEMTTQAYIATAAPAALQKIHSQLKALLAETELNIEEFGNEANRWFGSEDEARHWLEMLLPHFLVDGGDENSVGHTAKDSNGAALLEGDSVMVIKDLKVKGGTSDLKRGTLIKKIHLTSDSGMIECKVDGSTLVLKTIFLKKA